MTGLRMWKSRREGVSLCVYVCKCVFVCRNEMAGRSGVTRQGQGWIAGIRAEG